MKPLPKIQSDAIDRALKKHVDMAAELKTSKMYPPNQYRDGGELELEIGFAKGADEQGLSERCSNAEGAVRKALGEELNSVLTRVTMSFDVPPVRTAIIERSIKERFRGKARIVKVDPTMCFNTSEPEMLNVYVIFDKNDSKLDAEEIWPDLADAVNNSIGEEMDRNFTRFELAAVISGSLWCETVRDPEESAEEP